LVLNGTTGRTNENRRHRRGRHRGAAGIAATFVTIGGAQGACPGADEIDRFLADWTAKKPTKALPVTNMADAVCARDKLVEKMRQSQGKVVGYKAGLTAKATQERFGANARSRASFWRR
jgi:hypothetical protein